MYGYDETTGLILLVVLVLILVGYLLYAVAVGASYVATAILAFLYTLCGIVGSLLIAGLDFLLCPAGIDLPPWVLWTSWGALCGGAAGFWTVAPVYGLRNLRRMILAAPPAAIVLAAGVGVVLHPDSLRALVQPKPGLTQAAQQYSGEVRVRFDGVTKDAETSRELFLMNLNGDRRKCAEGTSEPVLYQQYDQRTNVINYTPDAEAVENVPVSLAVELREALTPVFQDELLFNIRISPAIHGNSDTANYWTTAEHSGGYLIWFMDQAGTHTLFVLIVEPSGNYRFVDQSLWGSGPMEQSQREYVVTQRSGIMGMGRRRQYLQVDWNPAGFRRDDGVYVESHYLGQGHYVFPEGELCITLSPPTSQR